MTAAPTKMRCWARYSTRNSLRRCVEAHSPQQHTRHTHAHRQRHRCVRSSPSAGIFLGVLYALRPPSGFRQKIFFSSFLLDGLLDGERHGCEEHGLCFEEGVEPGQGAPHFWLPAGPHHRTQTLTSDPKSRSVTQITSDTALRHSLHI
eukprot:2117411-Rhodomonas_salina.2